MPVTTDKIAKAFLGDKCPQPGCRAGKATREGQEDFPPLKFSTIRRQPDGSTLLAMQCREDHVFRMTTPQTVSVENGKMETESGGEVKWTLVEP